MRFLGRWISEGKVHCDHKHVDAMRRLPLPSTVREMCKWLGIVNFTRPFLPGIAEYQRRLNKIGSGIPKRQSNRISIKWTKELVQDFAKVRDMVMETVGTSTYNPKLPLYLATDGSDFAIGGIIYQLDDKKRIRPLGFFSKGLNEAQQSYGVIDKELLALEGSIRHFFYLMEGNHCPVYVDHKPLVNILQSKNCHLHFRKLRLLFLSEFDLDINHVDGLDNEVADYLSRIKLRKIAPVEANVAEVDEDTWANELVHFKSRLTTDWLENIRQTQKELLKNKPQSSEWNEQLGLWMYKHKRGPLLIWIPDESILDTLIKCDHDWCHFSWKQTYRRIRQLFFWLKLRRKVKTLLDNCDICQRIKAFRRLRLSPAPFEAPNEAFSVVHVDHLHMGENDILPNVTECLTMIDRFMGILVAVPVTHANAQQSLLAFFNHFISRYGVPKILISDNGPAFRSRLWAKAMQAIGIEHRFTLPYNPQCNGKVERVHRTLLTILRGQEKPRMWPVYLPFAMLAINTYYDLERNTSPSLKSYGFHIKTPGIPLFDNTYEGPATTKYIPKGPISMEKARWENATWAYVKVMHRSHKLNPFLHGPYLILERDGRSMKLQMGSEIKTISYQHLLPAKPKVRLLVIQLPEKSQIDLRKYAK